jgi:hypothetical protein
MWVPERDTVPPLGNPLGDPLARMLAYDLIPLDPHDRRSCQQTYRGLAIVPSLSASGRCSGSVRLGALRNLCWIGEMRLDDGQALGQRAGRHVHEAEPVLAVDRHVHLFEQQGILVADPARRSRLDEAERADEEHLRLVHLFAQHPGHLLPQQRRDRTPKPPRQCQRAQRGPVEDLRRDPALHRTALAVPLECHDQVDEVVPLPRLRDACGVQVSDHVRRCLSDNRMPPRM